MTELMTELSIYGPRAARWRGARPALVYSTRAEARFYSSSGWYTVVRAEYACTVHGSTLSSCYDDLCA